jgi:transposase
MKTNGRHRSPAVQEDVRRRVVRGIVEERMSQVEAVRVFGVGRTSIHRWLKAYRQGGVAALRSQKRGPKPHSRLAGHQAATLVRLIEDRCPDQLHLPFALWTREAVQQLLAQRFGLQVSVWTVGRYLQHWGFTPQKPLRRAYEQNPAAVRHWLETEYPALRRRAKAEQAEIHWGDEMGMRSDHQVGTSYGRRGRTPTIPGTGQRFGCNMISAITNRGRLAFSVFKCRFTTPVFVAFLKRLVRQLGRKAFLIVDGHPVHRAAAVKRWVAEHARQLRLFYLPGYSPKLNPDELLNQDVKSNAVGRQRPQNRQEMVSTVRAYLRSTQRRPDIVQNYFRQEDVRYAAM